MLQRGVTIGGRKYCNLWYANVSCEADVLKLLKRAASSKVKNTIKYTNKINKSRMLQTNKSKTHD